MERIIDRNGKKRRITLIAIPGILLLFVIGVLGYGFCIYNGYLLLNNPSKKQYPVSGIDLSHYQGEVDWPVLAQQNIMFAYIKATEGSSHTFSFDSSGDTQADHFIHTAGNRSGMLPPAVDVEYYADKKSNPQDPESVREQLQIMLDRLEEYYHKPPVLYRRCMGNLFERPFRRISPMDPKCCYKAGFSGRLVLLAVYQPGTAEWICRGRNIY